MKLAQSKYVIITLLLLFVSGCIVNDIPYPKVVAEISSFEVSGQIGESKINKEKRIVEIELADSVDLTKVTIKKFEVTNDAVIIPELTSTIDLSSPVNYKLKTYQEYSWQIIATQQIERYVKVKNQVGEASFNLEEKTVLVGVSFSQSLENITIVDMKLGPQNSEIIPEPKSVKDFTSPHPFTIKYRDVTEIWYMSVVHKESEPIETGAPDPWAKRAILNGKYEASMGDPFFQYKKSDALEWTDVATENVKIDGTKFSATITGLTPNTAYTYMACAGSNTGQEVDFTTESEEQMPNMSFDQWVKVGKSWYPNQDNDDNFWWDSGNEGANTLSETNPTSPETAFVAVEGEAKKAVRMESIKVLGVMAAGNVYSGDFIKTDMASLSAIVSFGRPYTSRPLSLEGYYSYAPVVVDCAKDPYLSEKGKMDHCQIRVVLADWSAPFEVNTAKGNMINVDTDPNVIAYAIMESDENTGGYKKFKLDLTYKNNRKPKFCVISVSASRYGDFFTGGVGSTMYIDEFQFVF